MTLARALLIGAAALHPCFALAQDTAPREALKRAMPVTPARPTCAVAVPAKTPTEAQRRQARALAQRGQQSAILGDRAAARDQLRQAAALDPTDADLAYQLARAHEAAAANAEAAKEYCRFLALAPRALEAAEARERIATLGSPTLGAVSEQAVARFQVGISAYERGQVAGSEAAFTDAIKGQPEWAEAYYNRAIVRLARGDRENALNDLEQYLRLKPEAEDRTVVVARIDAVRRGTLSPSRALSLGLVLPGGGQFYTGRPGRGFLALASVGAALACGLRQSTTTTTVQETAIDPFGNPYTFTTTRQRAERPCLAPGLAVAGAIGLVSAVEAFVYARHANAERRVSLEVVPRTSSVIMRMTLR